MPWPRFVERERVKHKAGIIQLMSYFQLKDFDKLEPLLEPTRHNNES